MRIRKVSMGIDFLIVVVASCFATGLLIGCYISMSSPNVWDRAAAVGDNFSGYEIVIGAEGPFVGGTLAEMDAIVDDFIHYRLERYGEIWKVTPGVCGEVIVTRIA